MHLMTPAPFTRGLTHDKDIRVVRMATREGPSVTSCSVGTSGIILGNHFTLDSYYIRSNEALFCQKKGKHFLILSLNTYWGNSDFDNLLSHIPHQLLFNQ